MNKLVGEKMNIWRQAQANILAEYPKMPIRLRVLSWLAGETNAIQLRALKMDPPSEASQTFITRAYKGKSYLIRFGWK